MNRPLSRSSDLEADKARLDAAVDSEAQPRLLRSILTAAPIGLVMTAIALLAYVPLTYDEAWNYENVASRGAGFAFRSYEFPNNHTLFSILQTFVPASLVSHWPPFVRVLNAAITFLLLGTIHRSLGVKRPLFGALVTFGIAFSSPILTTYFFVARGYLLGTLLLLSATLAARAGRMWLAGVLGGLSAAVVPTFGYALPGLATAAAVRPWRNSGLRAAFRVAAALASSAAITIVVFYLPKFGKVLDHRKHWMVGSTFSSFTGSTARFVGTGPWLSFAVVLLLVLAAVCSVRRHARGDAATRTEIDLPLFLVAAVLSFYLCVAALSGVGFANPPFERNAVFVPLFIWLAMVRFARDAGGRWFTASSSLVFLNAAVGLVLFWRSFLSPLSDPNRYPIFASLGSTPIEKTLRSRQLHSPIRFEANWISEPVMQLYGQALHVPLTVVGGEGHECAVGRVLPVPSTAVWSVEGETRRLLCF